MDIIRLYQDFGIEFKTEGHKHCRPGWINCECPFCTGNAGLHLGWNLQDEYFICWRCGWKPLVLTLSALLNIPEYEVRKLLPQYGITRTVISHKIIEKIDFSFPTNTKELQSNHRKYLLSRNFDPDKIIEKWHIKATGPIAMLSKYNYKFRIIIPFEWNGQIVSFDARDITEKQLNKYQACPAEYEIKGHKQILYGNQEKWNPDIGICVEGPIDVWRLGKLAFATSGIKYTHEQVRIMANTFKSIAVVYDDDGQAQIQANKLISELKFRGVNAWNVKIKGDPGGLLQNEANKLVKQIILKK